jgi:hypothetical protein
MLGEGPVLHDAKWHLIRVERSKVVTEGEVKLSPIERPE